MDTIEREVMVKALEAEIVHLQKIKAHLVKNLQQAKNAISDNEHAQENKRRQIISLLKEAI